MRAQKDALTHVAEAAVDEKKSDIEMQKMQVVASAVEEDAEVIGNLGSSAPSHSATEKV